MYVNDLYGYTLFLDDLPGAVKLEHSTHYDDHIPIGFIPETKNNT